MMDKRKWGILAVLLLLTAAVLSACAGNGGEAANKEEPQQNPEQEQSADNELFIFTAWPAYFVDENMFEQQVGQYIKKKFPDIKLTHVAWDDGSRYEDLIAKGTIPDIVFDEVQRNTYRQIDRFKLQYDMTDLIKKYQFDTGTLLPADLENSKNASDGKLYSLPYSSNEWVMIYNKDLFDQFGVDYPKAGMTWDEACNLAKKMTRQVGDKTYKGFQMNPAHYMRFNQLSESALDPNADKSHMNTPTWSKIVDNIRRFYEIPGNQLVKTHEFAKGDVAMIIDSMENLEEIIQENNKINFGFAPVPVFPEAPNAKFQANTNGMFITRQSKHKDLAFQVIAYLLSPEYQMEVSKDGVVTPLKDKAVQAAFGQNVPDWKGRGAEAVFSQQNAGPPARKPGLTYIYADTDQVWKLISTESKDTQTALRITDESMNKSIDETIAAHKAGEISPYE